MESVAKYQRQLLEQARFMYYETPISDATERPREERYFGLWDQERESLVLARHDCLIAYGNLSARERLMQRIHQWVELFLWSLGEIVGNQKIVRRIELGDDGS